MKKPNFFPKKKTRSFAEADLGERFFFKVCYKIVYGWVAMSLVLSCHTLQQPEYHQGFTFKLIGNGTLSTGRYGGLLKSTLHGVEKENAQKRFR